ncbi:MAG: pseudaminic acid cytidylyltransferase [Lachnospiraceae bacterium]|nr:pseudaminic acid cytidylyltransferase [Lachnospiraceae bacterium]
MSTIAIITARGGSKRIPHKNIRNFIGKPVIAYAIDAALKARVFDRVMVSTDDMGIADIAKRYGAEVPFMRSEKTSDDFATTTDVLKEVLTTFEAQGEHFDIACCIYPTAPLLTGERIREAMQLMEEDMATDVVLPVVRFSYPPQRAFMMENDTLTIAYPEFKDARSQDLVPFYHDAGQFYLFRTEFLLQNDNLFSGKLRAMELMETEVQDIDTETDWAMAELKYQWIHAGEGV